VTRSRKEISSRQSSPQSRKTNERA
jgi:hypothetical protein